VVRSDDFFVPGYENPPAYLFPTLGFWLSVALAVALFALALAAWQRGKCPRALGWGLAALGMGYFSVGWINWPRVMAYDESGGSWPLLGLAVFAAVFLCDGCLRWLAVSLERPGERRGRQDALALAGDVVVIAVVALLFAAAFMEGPDALLDSLLEAALAALV
jgi:hypothetical protein